MKVYVLLMFISAFMVIVYYKHTFVFEQVSLLLIVLGLHGVLALL